MRGITLDYLEDKARSNQEASAVAYKYANVFVYAKEQRCDAQDVQRATAASARRYLWAAIDRAAHVRLQEDAERIMRGIDYGSVSRWTEEQKAKWLEGNWDEKTKGSTS